MGQQRVRILLVDDHEMMRAGLCRLLECEPNFEIVAEAGSGEEACRWASRIQVDVVVLDLSMPGVDVTEYVRRIRSAQRQVRILVFSLHETQAVVERALAVEADGYLTKSGAAESLIEAVRTIASGRRWLSREADHPLALRSFGQVGAETSGLSGRQCEVLRLFARGLEFDEIADILHLSPKTVADTLATTKQRLGVCSSAELMRLALSDGLSAG